VDAAVAGTQTITVDTDINLAVTVGSDSSTGLTSTSSQYAVLLCTGARTALRFINTPKQSKIYVVINDTTGGYAVTVRGGPSSPTTGVTVPAGGRAIIAWDGGLATPDFVSVGGGSAAGSNTQVQFNSSGSFGASANLTFDGTTLTANDLIDSSLTASKPVFTNGTKNLVSTGTLGVDQGGTGLSTTTAYSVVFAGTTATGNFQAAAGPGTATHVLTSNGAGALPTFQAPAASGVSQARATMISFIFGF
jgi:hypothetical protein